MPDHAHAQSLRFRVKIDGQGDLGNWSKCDGLSVEYDVFEYKEGGENGFVHRIPGRVKYQNVKLTRPVNKDTSKVANWMATLKVAVKRQTAEISALDTEGHAIATWNLEGVFPVKWNGPSLDIGANQVATETLELAHNGFLTG
ncbi:MAG TPA: phage tail protein [Candidatus Dormibacteraeota bacterium]|nr:phage tail protein [Candidatus Dormibacteraeota bacterium]